MSFDVLASASPLDRARLSLRTSRSPRAARVLARMLGVVALLVFLSLVFVPWQQSLPGRGRVIAYAPLERQQTIGAPIEGRVESWYVQEGSRVRAGDVIAEMTDNDPEILQRIERERQAIEARKLAAQGSVDVAEAKITALEIARDAKFSSAGLRVDVARDRLRAAERAVDAARASERAAELNLDRQQALYSEGLASQRQFEVAEAQAETRRAGLDRALATLRAAKRDIERLDADREHDSADAVAKVEEARDSLRKAESELAKADADLQKIDVRMARQQQMSITAPRDGRILRLIKQPGAEMIKAGEPLATFVPDINGSKAVELWVDGNNGPLITAGRKVRLQFEGWPAVQFVGWPSAAVGTFGGVVEFVDALADNQGRFRVVVLPDEEDDPWPENRFLRQGVRANGWVLLDQVSLGFELWRQFNGFPPSVDPNDGSYGTDGGQPKIAGGGKGGKSK